MYQLKNSLRIKARHVIRQDVERHCDVASLTENEISNTGKRAVIELIEVGLSFGKESVFKNINLVVFSGDSYVIVGPSGGGKSSLLKLMAGLVNPTKGEIKIENKNWQTMKRADRDDIAKRTGMLFQKNAIFDSLTVLENVAFPLREKSDLGEDEIRKTARHYLDAVEIDHARSLYPDEISGGMQKRLGIARALALKPDIVFYDDPTAGLDPITSRKIIQLIVSLQKEMKTTLVAVTNDMNRVEQLANIVGMVVDQELIHCGSPAAMKTNTDPRVQQFIRGDLFGPLTVLS